jgi:hypothetical protein
MTVGTTIWASRRTRTPRSAARRCWSSRSARQWRWRWWCPLRASRRGSARRWSTATTRGWWLRWLGSGSLYLYILDPIDDENTCHQAWFKPETIRLGADVRLAFCYRWLSKAHEFFSDEHGELRDALAPTPEIIEAAAKRERERKRRAALRRKRGF